MEGVRAQMSELQAAAGWRERLHGGDDRLANDDRTMTAGEAMRVEKESIAAQPEAPPSPANDSLPPSPAPVVLPAQPVPAAAPKQPAQQEQPPQPGPPEQPPPAAEAREEDPGARKTTIDREHDANVQSAREALVCIVEAGDDTADRIGLAVRLLIESFDVVNTLNPRLLRNVMRYAPSIRQLAVTTYANDRAQSTRHSILMFTDGGYRRHTSDLERFVDLCDQVVNETLTLIELVTEHRSLDDHTRAIRAAVARRGHEQLVTELVCQIRPAFPDWNDNGNLLCGENGLYETVDGRIVFRKAMPDDHVYLTVGYDLPEDLAAVRETNEYMEFETSFTRIFKDEQTRAWMLKTLARIAFEGRVAYETKLSIVGIAHRNAAKTTFFKLFLRTLSDLRDGYATRINFAALTAALDESHGTVAAMYVDFDNKRFGFADEGSERNRSHLALVRFKRIADGSGASVRVAHARENTTLRNFGLLACMANPSNFLDVPEPNDRKNYALLTNRDFATFTTNEDEVDEENHVFLAEERFKGDADLDAHRRFLLALLAKMYDPDHKIVPSMPKRLTETTANWDTGLAIEDCKLADIPSELVKVNVSACDFKTPDEYTSHLIGVVLQHRMRCVGKNLTLAVREPRHRTLHKRW